MNRKVLTLGASAALVLAVAAAAAPALTAAQTERTAREAVDELQRTLGASGIVRIENHTYRRGLLNSTDELTLVADAPSGALTGALEKPLRVRVITHIHQGPLPGLREVGLASADTELVFDPAIQRQIDAAFGGKKPIIHTLIGFGGRSDTRVNVPSGRLGQDGDELVWSALSGSVRADTARTRANFQLPSLTLRGKDGEAVTLSGTRLTSEQAATQDLLRAGEGSLSADALSVNGGGQRVALRGLKVTSSARPAANVFEGGARYEVQALTVGKQTLHDLKLHLAARHLDRQGLETVIEATRNINAQAQGGQTQEARQEKLLQGMMDGAQRVLRNAPEFAVDRLSLREPSGEVRLSARLSLANAERLDLQNLMNAGPEQLLGLLRLNADFSAREAAARELLATLNESGANGGDPKQNLDALVTQGLLARGAGTLSARVAFDGARLLVNGKPIPLN